MKMARVILAVLCLVVGMADARAALDFLLSPAAVNAAAGATITFTGTLTNTDAVAKIFLNDLTVSVSVPAGLTLRRNTFFANVPGILLPGESYTGPIFSVTLGTGSSPTDYTATVTVSGGADVLASGALAATAFTVLSPAVTVSATVPEASEFGPVSGAITVSRTGATMIPLNVDFTIGGSAVNGTACAAIAPSLTLAAGVSSANIAVTPIPNNVAEGDRTVLLTLAISPGYNPGAGIAGTVTIHDKPADRWRLQNFGAAANTPAASDTASWAQDGVANVVKYGLGIDPTVGDVLELPQPTMVSGYLTLSFVPNPNATDVQFSVEGCPDLTAWSVANVEAVTLSNPIPPTRLTYRYRVPFGLTGAAFLRLKMDRIP